REVADPRAVEGVVVEGGGVGGRDLAGLAGGRRVGRVDADDGVQGYGGVGDAAGDRAGGVLAEGERDDPVAAHEPDGRAHADELVVGRRDADRAAGVRAEADPGEVGGQGRARPAAGAAGGLARAVRAGDVERG